jgi:hypothetical protein
MVGLSMKKSWLIITGIALLAMAILAGFAFGYVFNEIYDSENTNLTQDNLNANMWLFKFGIAAWLVIIVLNILISLGLYQIYRSSVNRVAAISSSLRVLYTFVLCVAVYFLAQPILVNMDTSQMLTPFESFLSIWNVGLIIFGAHLVLLSVNCIKSEFTPQTIAALVLIGGFSYIIVHGLKVSLSAGSSISNTAESLLVIPMALAELILAIWLIYRSLKLVEEKSIASNT